ncbi:MAG: 1-phosphofructokinase family hexose kinase [Lachnospiraceae bacterium]|nr:1-phosphofructokinase family hexose kinase [Lachnospiraceae bacterium]
MIVTVTMNPAIDKTAEVDEFVVGGVNRLRNVRMDAGGKGINVSKTLRVLNKPSVACGFIGGNMGENIRTFLQKMTIVADFVPVAGETRCNLKVKSKFGMTEFDEPGPSVRPEELDDLLDRIRFHAKPGSLFVLSGSAPAGVPEDTYARMTEMLHGCGCKVFLDTSGVLLRRGLEAHPDYIKPNLTELMALYGVRSKFGSREAMISWAKEKAQDLFSKGPKFVAVSLGADGAVFCDGVETIHVPSKNVEVKSPVGAGDAMTAAIAYGLDSNMHFRDIVRYAMAVSTAACMTEGSQPPTKELIVQLLRQE